MTPTRHETRTRIDRTRKCRVFRVAAKNSDLDVRLRKENIMKQRMIIIIAALAVVSAQAETDLVKIAAKVQEGDNLLAAPSVTVLPGKNAQIAVTQDYVQDSNLTLPTGIIIDTVASFKGEKISYSILLTVRESIHSEGDVTAKAVSTFKTRELMLSGVAIPGGKVEAKLDEQTTFTITLEKVAPDGKTVTYKSNNAVEQRAKARCSRRTLGEVNET